MAFRKKADFILELKPDVLIIPECENEEKLNFGLFAEKPNSIVWYGNNPNKGIGVFSYGDYKVELLNVHNPQFQFVLPLSVTNLNHTWIVFAVWSQKPELNDNYTEQVWNAIQHYNELLKEDNIILAGDFNSNSIWDKKGREANHSNMVDSLEKSGISSVYHQFHGQVQGEEEHPTLFMQRKIERPYHIDYCFASNFLLMRVENIQVGNAEMWLPHSDHMPLIIDFNL